MSLCWPLLAVGGAVWTKGRVEARICRDDLKAATKRLREDMERAFITGERSSCTRVGDTPLSFRIENGGLICNACGGTQTDHAVLGRCLSPGEIFGRQPR